MLQPIMSALVACTAKAGRIDLLGCNLLDIDPALVCKLEQFFGMNFTASDDQTGNPVAGGDWILESDGLDISADYFDAGALQAYNEVMWGWCE